MRDANWKADYLANHLTIAEATLHLGDGELRWDPVAFSYGPLKGTASLTVPLNCPADEAALQPCPPQFQVRFGDLDAAAFQTALLGAREKSTLLSELIERFHPSTAPPWPQLEGTVTVDSLVLGAGYPPRFPCRAHSSCPAQITSFDAGLLGGTCTPPDRSTNPPPIRTSPTTLLRAISRIRIPRTWVASWAALDWRHSRWQWQSRTHWLHRQGSGASAKGALHFEARRERSPRSKQQPMATRPNLTRSPSRLPALTT